MDMTKNQTNFYPLGKDKEIIIELLEKDVNIVSLLMPDYNSTTSTVDIDILLKEHIFDVISIDATEEDAKTYICIETYIPEVESNTIKTIGIIINVFAHKSLITLSNDEKNKCKIFGLAGNRIDSILDLIDRCVNGKRNIGIGKIRLKSRSPVTVFQPHNNYYGKSVEYIVSDFNDIPLV